MDFTLSFISFAALLVKVTARTDPALTPVYIRYAVLIVMALVFPEPAPARIRSGPSVCSTASFCLGLRRAISLDISIDILYFLSDAHPEDKWGRDLMPDDYGANVPLQVGPLHSLQCR